MLLIVGGDSDPNTQRIVDQAHMREIGYFFWDTDSDDCLQIAWDFHTPDLDLGSKRIRPDAIFLRWNVFGGEAVNNIAAFEIIQSYAYAWPHVRLLNRKTITHTNNKALNLRLAREHGFDIPESLVLGNLSPLHTMPKPEQRIAKPLGGGAHTKSITELIEDPQLLKQLPPQFIQERLSGENLRLFSVAGNLFCFHLATSHLDYREDDLVDVQQVDVPSELSKPTSGLVAEKGFDYCALDFRCIEGFSNPVFLEINSFPMFVRFDDAGKNCIADAILEFLSRAG